MREHVPSQAAGHGECLAARLADPRPLPRILPRPRPLPHIPARQGGARPRVLSQAPGLRAWAESLLLLLLLFGHLLGP